MAQSRQKSIAAETSGSGKSLPVQIEAFEAPLADEGALERLLAMIPYPLTVRPLLQRSFFGRRWECVPECDYWLASDGAKAVCLKITGADTYTIARLRRLFDDMRISEPTLMPSAMLLHKLLMSTARQECSPEPDFARDTQSA